MSPLSGAAPVLAGAGAPMVARLFDGTSPAGPPQTSFFDMLSSGMRGIEAKVINADTLVQQFALGDSVPLHQVTFALEEARLAVELAMQVRNRLVESYRDLMGMQL